MSMHDAVQDGKIIKEKTLVVGCGVSPIGDVNVDLSLHTMQIVRNQKTQMRTGADIIADGNYLPFKDNCFVKVISHHVIEHTKTPFKFLKELVRVSSYEIEIKCPHKLSKAAKSPYHVSFFTKRWFVKVCKQITPKGVAWVRTNCTMFKLGYLVLPFERPNEIILNIKKNVYINGSAGEV